MTARRSVAIIGAGAAGLMAAARLADAGVAADVFEQNEKIGRKLRITGKGRCNITNKCDRDAFLQNVIANPRFLYSALTRFSPDDLIAYLEGQGLPLKVERGNRVFPVSDQAQDVIHIFDRKLRGTSVRLRRGRVTEIRDNGPFRLVLSDGTENTYDIILLATGGITFPKTGSRGVGYRFAPAYGHDITKRTPVLVSLLCAEDACARMQGLTLKNVRLKLYDGSKRLFDELGEVLFTHKGISGPLALTASSLLRNEPLPLQARIDCKPGLDADMLDARILRDFASQQNRALKNSLHQLLPRTMIPEILAVSGIAPEKPVNLITRADRGALSKAIKGFPLTVTDRGGADEAVITAGGVSVRQVNPTTMESKLVKDMYFAGEILDVDALTGGFNLHIAFATAVLAAEAIIEKTR